MNPVKLASQALGLAFFKLTDARVWEYDGETEQIFIEANEKWTDHHRLELEKYLRNFNKKILVSRWMRR